MVLEFRFGQMEQNTKVIGKIIRPVAMENFSILMAISLKENGERIKLTELASISIVMELYTRVIGNKISSMAMELKLGPIIPLSRDYTMRERSKVKEGTNGQMEAIMKVNGKIIRLMGSESIIGQMEILILVEMI